MSSASNLRVLPWGVALQKVFTLLSPQYFALSRTSQEVFRSLAFALKDQIPRSFHSVQWIWFRTEGLILIGLNKVLREVTVLHWMAVIFMQLLKNFGVISSGFMDRFADLHRVSNEMIFGFLTGHPRWFQCFQISLPMRRLLKHSDCDFESQKEVWITFRGRYFLWKLQRSNQMLIGIESLLHWIFEICIENVKLCCLISRIFFKSLILPDSSEVGNKTRNNQRWQNLHSIESYS
jgi:hypothetical protein